MKLIKIYFKQSHNCTAGKHLDIARTKRFTDKENESQRFQDIQLPGGMLNWMF